MAERPPITEPTEPLPEWAVGVDPDPDDNLGMRRWEQEIGWRKTWPTTEPSEWN